MRDGGSPSLNSTGTFTVEVAATNDYSPEFQEPFEFNITENSAPTDSVFTFMVTDEDTGDEGVVNLTLVQSDYSANFSLEFSYESDHTEGRLYLLDPFDRETITNFTLTIEAEDTGHETYRRSAAQNFTVTVLDTNDNAPEFTSTPYSATVAEDRTGGYIFFRVSATDEDSGSNQELLFSLSDDFSGTFAIDAASGNVSVEGTLLRATRDSYLLEVVVTDGGDPALNDTTTINVTIDEVNDNVPYFVEPTSATTVTLDEDTSTGYVVLNVSVGDDDTGLAGEVGLSLRPSDVPFALENGSLVVDGTLDYEVRIAWEGGGGGGRGGDGGEGGGGGGGGGGEEEGEGEEGEKEGEGEEGEEEGGRRRRRGKERGRRRRRGGKGGGGEGGGGGGGGGEGGGGEGVRQ